MIGAGDGRGREQSNRQQRSQHVCLITLQASKPKTREM